MRLALIVVLATLLGPLIGSVPFLLVTAVQVVSSGGSLAEIAEASIPIVMFAYVLGGIIAFVAGTVVAIAAIWREPTFATIIMATLISNAGCYLAIRDTLLQSPPVNLTVSIFAATICWLLFRHVMSRSL
jgi:hypothetical protein